MGESHRPRPRGFPGGGNSHREAVGRTQLPGAVTGGAIAFGGPLMMTDQAAPRRFERDLVFRGSWFMAGEAGEFLVPLMREAVGWLWWKGWCVAFHFVGTFRRLSALQRSGCIEGERR